MPIIRPISDLRSYASVLDDVKTGRPVFLTKNGRGRYAIVDINEYEDLRVKHGFEQLAAELEKGRRSGEQDGWMPLEDAFAKYGV